jgi:hypothetical protein
VWGREELIVRDGANRLFRVRPGERAPRPAGSLGRQEFLGGVGADGTLLLWSARSSLRAVGEPIRDLHRLDLDTGRRTLETSVRGGDLDPYFAPSADGRYLLLPEPDRPGALRLRDLERHEDALVTIPGATRLRAVWVGTRLFVRDDGADATRLYEVVPGAEPRQLGAWTAGTRLRIAPDGGSALVFGDGERATYLKRFADGSEVELRAPPGDPGDEYDLGWGWAAPDTLFFDGAKSFYLVDARDPATAPRLPIR